MHTSKWLIGLVSLAYAAVAFSPAPAGAVIVSPESGSYVSVANNWQAQFNTFCDESFFYVQRMTIDGVSTMVPTNVIYAPGRYALFLDKTCDDGTYLYVLADATPRPS